MKLKFGATPKTRQHLPYIKTCSVKVTEGRAGGCAITEASCHFFCYAYNSNLFISEILHIV